MPKNNLAILEDVDSSKSLTHGMGKEHRIPLVRIWRQKFET